MNIDMNTIQQVRGMQDELDSLPDREYIKNICSIIGQMIDNPMTRNLDFAEARNLCKQFAEAIEVQLEQQAGNITEPENEDIAYEADNDMDMGESFVKQNRKPTLEEAKEFLHRKGFRLDG